MTAAFESLMAGKSLTELLAQASGKKQKISSRATSVTSNSSEDDKLATEKKMDYMEKRRRNNDSARRSREVRRLREQQTREKMEELEKENVLLQSQIALLRLEYNQLVLMLVAQQTSKQTSSPVSS
ncbi:unnamed protein product [Auanema sp. JU1783]|nr:unnamed protein product [Auanema sp. JU1783]